MALVWGTHVSKPRPWDFMVLAQVRPYLRARTASAGKRLRERRHRGEGCEQAARVALALQRGSSAVQDVHARRRQLLSMPLPPTRPVSVPELFFITHA